MLILPVLGKQKIVNFNKHPGIYFDGMGEGYMVSHYWHIINYYNMTDYWTKANQLENLTNRAKRLCVKPTCAETVIQVQRNFDDIKEMNLLIRKECHLTEIQKTIDLDKAKSRSKRGAIDIIGNVASDFFGLLDGRYSARIESVLKTVKENQNHNLDLIKHHTTIIDQTLKIVKDNDESIKRQFNEINEQLFNIAASISTNSKNIEFNNFISFLILALQRYRENQMAIHTVLKQFKKGEINPLLITPQELEKELVSVQKEVSPNYKLPSLYFEDLENLLDVAVVHGESCLMFHIEIPLLDRNIFEMYKLIPVPTLKDKKLVAIKPTTDMIAINSAKREYYMMSASEFQKCKSIRDMFICDEKEAVHKITKRSHCEIQLYLNQNAASFCDFQVYFHSQIWIELHRTNSWIFSFQKEESITVTCGDLSESLTIEGQGIFNLDPGCKAETDSSTLIGKKVKFSSHILKRIPPLLPDFDINDLNTTVTKPKSLILKLEDTSLVLNAVNDMKDVQTLKEFDYSENFINVPSFHDWISYASIIFILLVFGFAYFYKKHQNSSQSTIILERPTPSFNIPVID